ncbi:MAG: type II toxin-antitoxin system VapC family toxin [Bryobacteraceae bacterium]
MAGGLCVESRLLRQRRAEKIASALFADTFFFLALLNEDDPAHQRALTASAEKKSIVTTEFILLELGNACARAEDHADFLVLVAGMRASSRMTIVPLQTRLLARGLELMGSRSDENWSLTDCISFVVMEEHGLKEALTADRDFEQSGFKALFLS